MKIKYSIFVPCYNEEKCIELNLLKIFNSLGDLWKETEIIVVNDCSTDETEKRVKMLIKNTSYNIKIISYKGNHPTRRENLIESFKFAKGKIVAFLDADLSTDLKDLPNLLRNCEKYDICIGNRYDKKSKIKRSFKRFIISKCLNYATRLLFLTGIQDHFIGFKAFKKDTIIVLVNLTGYGSVWGQRSMWWDAEMLIIARLLGKSIKTIPVKWKESKWTKLNFKRELGIISYMFKYRINMLLAKWTN